MISKKELASFKSQTGFNIWQIEKDYLQHLFLLFLSRHSKREMVFKGGTALHKVYGLNRFSIDLDFTCTDENSCEAIMDKITDDINKFGYPAEKKKTIEKNGMTFQIKIKGPLYEGSEKSVSSLYIDASLREQVLMDAQAHEIVPIYPDILPYICVVMQKEEIMAEKVRTIMSRNKPRDVYDVLFLIKKGVTIDVNLSNQKLKYYNLKFAREDFIESIEQKRARWAKDMNTLVPIVPDFDKIKEEITKAV